MKFLTIWRMPTVRHVPPELAHPASSPSSPPSPPLFRVCVRARGRCSAPVRGGRDYGLAFKAACCESERGQRDERTLAPDKQRTTEEGRNPPDGGEWRRNLYRGRGGRKGRGRRIRSCQSPRIATLIPIPFVQFSSLFRSISFPSRVFSFDDGFGGWLSWKICFGKLRIWNNS